MKIDAIAESKKIKSYFASRPPKKGRNQKTVSKMPGRFFEKMAFGFSDCWYWIGSIDCVGYGRFPYEGETKAHRVSWKLFHGIITKGMNVLHKCDVRSCVNPDHLFLGTQLDNVADMVSKNRLVVIPSPGEKNGMAKLTREQVNEARSLHASGIMQKDICKRFGVSPMTISRIVRNQSWK